MNLNQLRNFKTLAELEHYTKAAKALYISQPSLTNEIKSLEKELGYQLFTRVGRGVSLTKYGRQLYETVSESLDILDSGLKKINQNFENDMAIMNIACIPTAVGTYLPQKIAAFKAVSRSLTDFKIYSKDTRTILAGVRNGAYDLGISSRDASFEFLEYIPLYDEPFIVILPADHPLANQKELSLAALKNYRIHTYTDAIPIGQELINAISPTTFTDLNIQSDATDEITVAGEVSVTHDLGIVADTMYLSSFDLIKIPLAVPKQNTRKVYASFRKENSKVQKIETLINFFKTH